MHKNARGDPQRLLDAGPTRYPPSRRASFGEAQMKKGIKIFIVIGCVVLSPGTAAQNRIRVFVAHTHTGTDQIGERYALEINQQLRNASAFTPVAVPQDAEVMLMLTSIDPDLNTRLAGRRTAMAQVVTFPPLKVIDYAIDIVPADQINKAAASAIVGMGQAVLSVAKRR
jgi:hypothetical protein